jgi:RNA-directed DNA polymerase
VTGARRAPGEALRAPPSQWRSPVGPLSRAPGRRPYVKAKAEKAWRFWGLEGHVAKLETLRAASATQANGAPGLAGVRVGASDEAGGEGGLALWRDARLSRPYRPRRNRRGELPKGHGPVRALGMPAMRDRVGQGARTRLLEPSGDAAFPAGSCGSGPPRPAPQAVDRGAAAVVRHQTRVRAGVRAASVDRVRHARLRAQVARRVQDRDTLPLRTLLLSAAGKRGVAPGGVLPPCSAPSPSPRWRRWWRGPRRSRARAGTRTWRRRARPTRW